MSKRQVYGIAQFNSPNEKKNIIKQLKREFGGSFSYRIDNNLISYELFVSKNSIIY